MPCLPSPPSLLVSLHIFLERAKAAKTEAQRTAAAEYAGSTLPDLEGYSEYVCLMATQVRGWILAAIGHADKKGFSASQCLVWAEEVLASLQYRSSSDPFAYSQEVAAVASAEASRQRDLVANVDGVGDREWALADAAAAAAAKLNEKFLQELQARKSSGLRY